MDLLREIPAEGEVTDLQIITTAGTCKRGCMGQPHKALRRHFQLVHPGGAPYRSGVDIIPPDGDIAPENLTTTRGFCLYGCNEEYAKLQQHFKNVHRNYWTTRLYSIPHDGQVFEEELAAAEGYCCMPYCEKRVGDLREHFKVHVGKETWACPKCGATVQNKSSTRNDHLESHSGPAKCLVTNCDREAPSVSAIKKHLKRYHRGIPKSTWRLLTEEEVAEFRLRTDDATRRTALRWVGRHKIPGLRSLLEAYSTVMESDATPYVFEAAAALNSEFEKYITVPEGAAVAYHGAYVSHWNADWRIPNLVMEVVDKETQRVYYSSSGTFLVDPQIDETDQPINQRDYYRSGYDRTHLAAASHFSHIMLAGCTYQYTNVLPATPILNRDIMGRQEMKILELADLHGRVVCFRFPLFRIDAEPTFTKPGSLVRVPDSIATVVIVVREDGRRPTIEAWETHQSDDFYNYELCGKEPFFLFTRAGITFNLQPADFSEISIDMV